MGIDSVEPFLKNDKAGIFLLCKTSNPSSADLQTLICVDKLGGPR